ncbi:BTB (POZ) domain-containing protein, partial [Dinochytrium kinnereticum]
MAVANITRALVTLLFNDIPRIPIAFITTDSSSSSSSSSSQASSIASSPLIHSTAPHRPSLIHVVSSTFYSIAVYSLAVLGVFAVIVVALSFAQTPLQDGVVAPPVGVGDSGGGRGRLEGEAIDGVETMEEKGEVERGKCEMGDGKAGLPVSGKGVVVVGSGAGAPKNVQTLISEKVTTAAVKDQLANLTQATLVGYNRVDSAFGIQDRLVDLGQMIVRGGVVASGIAANAFLRAGVAYHMTPSNHAPSTSPTRNDLKSGDGRGGPVVRIVRLDSVPGGMPFPEMVETSTQTDETLCGTVVAPTDAFSSPPSSTDTATRSPGNNPTLFQSVLTRSATVAAVLLTSSSNYVFGAETTRKLIGEEEVGGGGGGGVSARKREEEEEELERCSPIRNLMVGGVYYATTLETLRRVPGSRLAKWFPVDATKAQLKMAGVMMRDGTLFVDRDGTHFRHVLNHLRGLPLSQSLTTRPDLLSLRYEAVYYDLVSLVVELDERLALIDSDETHHRHRRGLEAQQALVGTFSRRAGGVPVRSCSSPSPESSCSDTCSVSSDDSSSTARMSVGEAGGRGGVG